MKFDTAEILNIRRIPGDFGLEPPSLPRPGKTLCDGVNIHTHTEALALLKKGIEKGLVSEQVRFDWPQNVWSVTNEVAPLEAQLEHAGTYHGYPMPMNDAFREVVLERWTKA